MQLDNQELAITLAGLRMIQRIGVQPQEHDVATDGDEFDPLGDDAIDELCERINGADPDPVASPAAADELAYILAAWPQFDPASPRHDDEVNGGDLVEWFGFYLERLRAAAAGSASPAAPAVPRIVVILEGGMCQGVVSDDAAMIGRTFHVVDYDIDGAEQTVAIAQGDGTSERAVVSSELIGASKIDFAALTPAAV